MNRDDIIRMAHKCGLCSEDGRDSDSVIIAKHLEQFANLVAAAEREACAALCERLIGSGENKDSWTITRDLAFYECAAAIRARREQ